MKRGWSLSFLVGTISNVLVMEIGWTGKNPIYRHIKSNNSGTAKVKIVKNEWDPPLFTSKQLIKF
jgi:peptide methionine sulfoxide reductase MsrA